MMSSFRNDTSTLIRTKLRPPRLGSNLIPRPLLLERLNQGLDGKLTLVSAQAGAGKTTLLVQWLEKCPRPSAWLSLDRHDNDLIAFATYLCAAVYEVYPQACQQSMDLLDAPQTPPLRAIVSMLVNELDAFFQQNPSPVNGENSEMGLILALDDYHNIVNPSVHDLLSELIAYLPKGMHLALTSRTDPPLPLARLRARSEMNELRTADLRFSAGEASALLELTAGSKLSDETIDLLANKTDGWAVGLHLAGLSIRGHLDGQTIAQRFVRTSNAGIADYLVTEVLNKQPAAHQDFLLRISILDRFCAELCDWVLSPEDETGQARSLAASGSAVTILHELAVANVFLIALDQVGRWYRLHHLFQDLLQHRLRRKYKREDIRAFHVRASEWFELQGLIDEALDHAFAAGQMDRAAHIVGRTRYELMNQARWQRLELYLRRFPAGYTNQEPELLMLKAWLLYHQGHSNQLPAALEQVETALGSRSMELEKSRHLQGEISALRSLLSIARADIKQTISEAENSLRETPPELWIVRSLGRVTLAAAYQAQGELTRAYETVYGSMDEEVDQGKPLKATTFLTACNIHWVAADMPGLFAAASTCIELCDYPHAGQIERHARYHLGSVHYLQNDLVAAEEQFNRVVQQPYLNYGEAFAHSAFGLSLTHEAQNRPDQAREVAELAVAHMLETGNMTLLPLANAFQAEIALRQGNVALAAKWAEQFKTTPPMGLMYRFYEPRLTLVKTWLAQDTQSGRRQATDYLDQLRTFVESTYNRRILIDVLALSAILQAAEGHESAALATLSQALKLAEPGTMTRPFVDLGSPMARLLPRLIIQDASSEYLRRILSSFEEPTDAGKSVYQATLAREPLSGGGHVEPPADLVEPLTAREMEVLELLGRRLTNKEIAERLFVSPQTVKSHTINIYAKLGVHGRREAVARARQLGLLS